MKPSVYPIPVPKDPEFLSDDHLDGLFGSGLDEKAVLEKLEADPRAAEDKESLKAIVAEFSDRYYPKPPEK